MHRRAARQQDDRPASRGLRLMLAAVLLLAALLTPAGPAHAASGDPVDELAQKYAPLVVVRAQTEQCGGGEAYTPATVDTVLGKPDVVLQGPGGEQIDAPTAADLAGKGEGWYLNLPGNPLDPGCTYEQWFRSVSAGTEPTLYARVATDPQHPGKLALQYWFFYVFNDWNDKHEGDWEMVQLVFPAGTAAQALSAAPQSVAFAQHEGSQVSPWDGGGLIRVGDRPVVYPGQGSHAAYFTQATWFGKSAAAGFGCDDTTPLGAEVQPAVVVLPDGPVPTSGPLAWLSYTGRWGQEEASFNNGPSGPVTKTQWADPISWQLEEGRTSAVSLPPAPGPALRSFCDLTAAGSLLFIDLLDQPVLVLAVLLALLVLAVALARRTAWRQAEPDHPDRLRRAGQIVTGAFGWVRRRRGEVTALSAVVVAVFLGSSLVSTLLLAPRPSADITDVAGLTGRWFAQVVLLVVALIGIALVGWVAAATISLVRDDAEGRRTEPRAALRAGWANRSAMVTVVVVLGAAQLLTGSLVLIPVAAFLVARWAVAPAAAVVEHLPLRAALDRSVGLTAGHRWRALAIQVLLAFIGLSLAGLVGALLLLVTSWPFWVVGLLTVCLLAVLLPVAFAGMALHYYDLREREQQASAVTGAVTRVQEGE